MAEEGLGELVARLRGLVRADGIHLVFSSREAEELFERIRDRIVDLAVGRGEVERARAWAEVLVVELRRASRLLGARGWSYSRELRSFLGDPRAHLRKKLFNYVFDLARGRIGEEEVIRRGSAAVRTSLRTNLRSIYQDWVLAAILGHLGSMGGRLIYPETGVILLERSGRQRSGSIPPNAIVRLSRGELSFFLEAPRPIGWEDTGDLARSWRLYTVLRPDMLVYPGRVLDIAAPDRDPPIIRPHTIIECKELPDWYERARDLRGPFAKPMRATEWRERWLRGLEEGLADILGVERRRVEDFAEGRARSLRVREHRLLLLYKETFKPERFYLVSRAPVPREVRADLESNGIIVYDDVEIGDRDALRGIAEDLAEEAAPPEGPPSLESIVRRALEEAEEAASSGGDPLRILGEALLKGLALELGDPTARRLLARLAREALQA
ncbi:MAG: hypothetical protein GSR80_000342 [Desulfurococcales archaeon]|nr:hypothetical protein [Desulfurococcales archaeon]